MKDGVIADFDVTQSMLRYFISKTAKEFLIRPGGDRSTIRCNGGGREQSGGGSQAGAKKPT